MALVQDYRILLKPGVHIIATIAVNFLIAQNNKLGDRNDHIETVNSAIAEFMVSI